MAELASGAVRSLLGVLRNEAQLLDRVEGDVNFIREEMESMNSFLQHLARTTPPGDHEEQVRTWMKQVRDLAYDCSNCIDHYLLRGDPAVYRAMGPVTRYLWWVPWYLRKWYAQHCAAIQLRKLKARAHDVGNRRLRYDVKIPEKSGKNDTTTTLAPNTGAASSSQAAGKGDTGEDEEEEEEDDVSRAGRFSDDRRALAFSEPRILEECTQELVNWLSYIEQIGWWLFKEDIFPSIAIAAPDKEEGADVALEALAHPSVATKFELIKLWFNFSFSWAPTPLHILEEILGELRQQAVRTRGDVKIQEKSGSKPSGDSGPEATSSSSQAAGGGDKGTIPNDEELDRKIEEIVKKTEEHLQAAGTERSSRVVPFEPLDILCDILQELLPGPVESVGNDRIEKKKINETAMKLKKYLEKLDERRPWIGLDDSDYVVILRELLPRRMEDMDNFDEDQRIEDITEKIKRIPENIKEHLQVKEVTKKIKEHIEGKRTIIVLHDIVDYVEEWEVIKWALDKLGCAAGSAVIVTTKYTQGGTQRASRYGNPIKKPIEYSLVGFYHDKAIRLTSPFVNEDYCNASILHVILKNCEHELCMKLFVRALYANPNRSNEELDKLRDTLDLGGQLETNARKMIKFSYSDLPKDYKTCFLYLAIFPQDHKIKRSTLVGRWVAEGLVTEEDWPSSVRRAERCFDALIDRLLVYPGDIGAAGKVKSCIVHDIHHKFITKIARKKHFVEPRLSHHLARHFSVLSDVRLRSSEDMPKFLRKLYTSPQYPLVKVLDLEDCQCFEKNQNYLKNICNKMLQLKYLSLRNTDITMLPKEINNLCQLEVLDIRHTHVMTASTTKHLVLLKLKRLLAGCIRPSPTCTIKANKSFSATRLPRGIGEMTNMEVLSHVEASQLGAELKDIGKLWQLRKLGVVIHDKKAHLKYLLRVIGDLSESLQSLSISIKPPQASGHGTPSNTDISFENPPKHLESLSISGRTSGRLLPLLAKSGDQLTKVTLHDTLLNQNDLKDLAELPKLRCVRLRHKSYIASMLNFKIDEFKNLKNFLVEGSKITGITFKNGAAPNLEKIVLSSTNITDITFKNGAAPNLEKIVLSSTNITGITFKNGAAPNLEEIVLSFTNTTNIIFENGATTNLKKIVLSFTKVEFLSGIDYLPVFKELELNGGSIASALLSLFTNANQLAKVTLRDTFLKQGDLQILAKKPNLRCLMLLDKSCDERQLTFNKEEFRNLKLLVVECFSITKISFAEGAAPKLEKIVWSFTDIESLSGIDNLPVLKELEFKGDKIPDRVSEAIEKHPKCPFLIHTKQKNQDKEEEAQQQRILDSN